MSHLKLEPDLVTPRGQEIVRIPQELFLAVDRCDALLRKHGMQMKLYCEHCMANGHPTPFVHGDNSRNGTMFEMTCPHAKRLFSYTTV